jgi:hypothetical protein
MFGGKEFQFFATEYLNADWPIALFTLSLESLLCMQRLNLNVYLSVG